MSSIQCIICMVKTNKYFTLKIGLLDVGLHFTKNEVKICITESCLAPIPILLYNILLSAIQQP